MINFHINHKTLVQTFNVFLAMLFSLSTHAQYAMFLQQGNITFEKKVNTVALMKERIGNDDDGWGSQILDAYKKSGVNFKTTYFNLSFNDGKTLYAPDKNITASVAPSDFTDVANDNIVYSDLTAGQSVSLKNIFGDKFLIKDSARKINWKITDEIRDIAGFHCRRANAIIMDSIYVVAFYSPEILTSGGPESFNGLPGMILGVALPHDHVTWFATKVSVNPPVAESDITPPNKGKEYSNKEYFDKIKASMHDWGKSGSMILQNAMY